MSKTNISGKSNPNWKGGKTVAHCVDCGKRISKYHKRCKSCAKKGESSPNWKGGVSKPVCLDCGKSILLGNERCSVCWYKFNTGGNHPNWQGGTSNAPYPYEFNKKLKDLIRERDNYTCQVCDIKEKDFYRKLDIHHIDYDKDNLDPRNLISLCQSCHSRTNFKREYWQKYFAELKGT